MRKKIIDFENGQNGQADDNRLDLTGIAEIELSSEDEDYPFEEALKLDGGSGWLASKSGKQTIRIIFDEPQIINTINLVFEEKEISRTQEFQLRWSTGNNGPFHEIVRQQYNFNPVSSNIEHEKYEVKLADVKVVELTVVPDINEKSEVKASLSQIWFT